MQLVRREKIWLNLAQGMIFHQVIRFKGFKADIQYQIPLSSSKETLVVIDSLVNDLFSLGTVWLLNEHKLCVQELQKLKSMIDDLHRCHHRHKILLECLIFHLKVHWSDSSERTSFIQCIQWSEEKVGWHQKRNFHYW